MILITILDTFDACIIDRDIIEKVAHKNGSVIIAIEDSTTVCDILTPVVVLNTHNKLKIHKKIESITIK